MSTLFIWLGILLIGAVLGCFIKPRTVAIAGALLMLVDIAGMLLAGFLADNKVTEFTWMFGIAGMAIPVIFTVAWMGASVVARFKGKLLTKDNH